MTPIKELGECVIGTGDREFFFRPSFRNMARIGEPEEIVERSMTCAMTRRHHSRSAQLRPISAMSTAAFLIASFGLCKAGFCHAKQSWPRIRYW